MIELKNVSKKYDNRYVLKNLKVTFPRVGLICINGPSGCGKSTLLNLLSSLIPFEGEIIFDGLSYKKADKNELDNLRNKKIGFVFQDYKLFEFETVKNNILLSIDLSSADSFTKKEKRVIDLLNLVGLREKENELVSNLSGGEKQRVAIARAIANSPKVLLADEPTGNLDSENTKVVMELLVKIASTSLVIMVSHDLEISKKYSDEIIKMNDGKIISHKYYSKNKHSENLPLLRLKYNERKTSLPLKFLFHHTYNSVKRRKWRTLFITMSTSLGLIGVGLASTLKEIISSNLIKSYSSIIDSDKLILSNKNQKYEKDVITSLTYEEVLNVKNEHENIDDIGVYYWNINSMFPTENYLLLDKEGNKKTIGNFNASSVNEFALIDTYKGNIYPNKIDELNNNEVVLSMPMLAISELCYQLQIPRTVESLSNYLENFKEVNLLLNLSNINWNYSVSIALKLKGFILSSRSIIYHSNKLWNEYIFEEEASLPYTNQISSNSEHPWDLKKVYYFSFSNNRDDFLKKYRFSINNENIDFEILDKKYYPNLFSNTDTNNCNRLGAFHRKHKDNLSSYIGEYCKKASKNVKKIIYGTSEGYSIYDQSLMMGFSKSTYLGSDLESVNELSEEMSYIKYEDSFNVSIPKNIIEGHYSKSQLSGFVFEPGYELIMGRNPINYQEILISDSLSRHLNISNPINKNIYLSFPIKENLLPNGYLSREYQLVELKIVGLTNSGKLSISHDEGWSILFFQSMLGISTFDLKIDNLALEVIEGNEEEVIDKINRSFPFVNVSAPLKEAKNSINRICGYIETIMLVVSITSVIIASLILFLCNYLHVLEIKKDVGLVRCLGVNELESRKFIYFHSFFMTLISLISSTIELLLVSIILSKVLAKTLYINSTFVFNPMSLLYMFITALAISLFSSILLSRKTKKLDPLKCLK